MVYVPSMITDFSDLIILHTCVLGGHKNPRIELGQYSHREHAYTLFLNCFILSRLGP